MRTIPLLIALFLSLILIQHDVVVANTTDENRRVSETLVGNEIEAEDEEEEVVPEPQEDVGELIPEQNSFLVFAQLISALLFVIILIYFLLRFINKRSQLFRSTQLMQNLGGVPLGANRSVQLVKVGNRVFVVGVGDTIQLLREIEDEQEIDSLLSQQQEQFQHIEQPISKLFHFVQKRTSRTSHEPPKNEDAFKHLLEKQLKDVSKSQEKLHDAVRESEK